MRPVKQYSDRIVFLGECVDEHTGNIVAAQSLFLENVESIDRIIETSSPFS